MMADTLWGAHTRKRKRRRGSDRPPIACQLVLDGRLKGDVGLLSEDLFLDLFPGLVQIHGMCSRRELSK